MAAIECARREQRHPEIPVPGCLLQYRERLWTCETRQEPNGLESPVAVEECARQRECRMNSDSAGYNAEVPWRGRGSVKHCQDPAE